MGCARRLARAAKRSGAQDERQVGRTAPEHSRRRELSLAHDPGGRHAAVRLAHAVLELPAEACQGPSILDDPGTAGAGNRPLPLDESTSFAPRALPSPDIP